MLKKNEPEWWRQRTFQWEQGPADSPEIAAAPSVASPFRATDDDLPDWFFLDPEEDKIPAAVE